MRAINSQAKGPSSSLLLSMGRFRERGDCVSKLQWTVPIQANTAACCLPLLDPEATCSQCLTLWGNELPLCWELGARVCPVLTPRGPTSLTPTLGEIIRKTGRQHFSTTTLVSLVSLNVPFFFFILFCLSKLGAKPRVLSPIPNSICFCLHGIFFPFAT